MCAATANASRIYMPDRKSTRLNSSHTVIYTLSLHDALPISFLLKLGVPDRQHLVHDQNFRLHVRGHRKRQPHIHARSEEHTSELQSHRDLHSFPTRRSSDLISSETRRPRPPAPRPRSKFPAPCARPPQTPAAYTC